MKIVEFLFTWTGARFYMDWLLPTNPKSKNPIMRHWARSNHWTFGTLQSVHSGKNPKKRLWLGGVWFVLHGVLAVLMCLYTPQLWLLNIYINIYPMIVQKYVMYRCLVRIYS